MPSRSRARAVSPGVTVLESSISSIEPEHDVLRYRGYAVEELVTAAGYEEVAWLLWTGAAPDPDDLARMRGAIATGVRLPAALGDVLDRLPEGATPLSGMLAALPLLPHLEPAPAGAAAAEFPLRAARLLGAFSVLAGSALRPRRIGALRGAVEEAAVCAGVASTFLTLARGAPAPEADAAALETVLILYADHELNASTFAGRVAASTRADLVACIVAALCTLSGPLHGGVDRFVRALLAAAAEEGIESVLDRYLQAGQPLPGFGHSVYRGVDPRAAIMRGLAERLAPAAGQQPLFALTRAIEEEALRRGLPPANVDLYTVAVYRSLGIPDALSPLVFATARLAGWCAHIQEQYLRNRLIRPRAAYIGPPARRWQEPG